ncbi:hypothetical protein [uncultured Pseudokineococcus sp.]|uniref:hypothetical protein n=1 Tax=uncultured Pseudokineococcus sp. TaxID=1642928 RepID=UPI0026158A8A|nr:hypothetical protein [uncultured Pseudokineococcus sp.]
MRDHLQADGTAEVREGWFVRTAERIGDLGSPFYDEEHQRDVWNEASAVGFQLVLWLLPVAAVVSVWVGGATAIPYALVMFLAAGLASGVVIGFAQARGLDLGAAEGYTVLRWRMLVFVVLFAALCVGVVRAAPEGSFGQGTLWGMLVGAAVAIALLAWGGRRARRVSP